MRQMLSRALLAAMVAFPATAFGAGYAIYEAGARALGMGGAFTAQASDPSAIFFNPAGMADLHGKQLYGGVSLIFTGTDFAGVDPDPGYGVLETTGTLVFPPVNAYYTHELRENLVAGMGFFNPYGLGQTWEDETTYSGRHISYDVQLRSYYFNPTLAWRANEYVAVGAGVQAVYSSVHLERYAETWDPNGGGYVNTVKTELDGNSTLDWGFNAGIKVTPDEDVTVGASFRSRVTGNLEGDANFTQVLTGGPLDPVVAQQMPADQGVSSELPFPWLISGGVAYSGIERWIVEVDLNYYGWSDFEQLEFNFDDPSLNVVRPQNYESKLSVRSGVQYAAGEMLDLRAGYYYDPTPQPTEAMSPFLGDVTRHGLSAGFGYHRGDFTVDGFVLILLSDERSTEGKSNDGFNGTYQAFGNLFGLNLGYVFGGEE